MKISNNRYENRKAGQLCLLIAATALCTGAVFAQAPSGAPPGNAGGVPFNGPMPARPLPADAPSPSSIPRDFEGTWHGDTFTMRIRTDMYGNAIPFNEAGKKLLDQRLADDKAGTPHVNSSLTCRPPGPQWQIYANPFTIHQLKDFIEFSFFYFHGRWNVLLDPKKGPPADANEYMGHSVAHWDGDTLVVETSGFKHGLWLDFNGTPASKQAKLTQRIRKVHTDHWFLEIASTLDDPKYYKRPWSWLGTFSWHPDQTIWGEFNCEEQVGNKNSGYTIGHIVEAED